MKTLKNIINVAFSNIIGFGTSFIVGFILPTILTVADYGNYRQYTLYLSFTYLFHLGFADGIYIKYGGADPSSLDPETIQNEHNFANVFQLVMLILMLAVTIVTKNPVLILFSIVTFFNNVTTYHGNFFQATGQFSLFTKGSIFRSVSYIVMLLIGILVIQSDNYVFYIVLNVISYVLMYIYFEYNFIKRSGFNPKFTVADKLPIFKVGFLILLANMSLTFVGNIGNWVVNWNFPKEQFAYYSFQSSVLNVIILIVNAVALVFYNMISKTDNPKVAKVIKRLTLLLGIFGGLGFFVFKFIIEMFISKYTSSIELLSITFVAIPYIMISKILISNLYKAKRSERKYIRDSIAYAVLSFIFVYLAYFLTHSMVGIAWATTACYFLWYMYTSRVEFQTLKSDASEWGLIISHVVVFYLTANFMNIYMGFIVYAVYLAIILVVKRVELQDIFQQIIKMDEE
ncbi:polysaccharide biosynthesis protein [Aerococcus urinaeequi]|uniref:Polysaccharide biosynthesis protein n=1 Tax=Aerococcus urinaeequi TaxID=51665 RepID=A0AAC9F3Q9_9LACT|nr:polysaccharide biosynthesis protein [Aerococcus urinaeequi]ALZ87345.1 polysaccharide biosynthesis protein [Aerococcus urinaeequi]AMB97160.1 polysaccharide biosynthesis protein [Aerococcus urinaeequi]